MRCHHASELKNYKEESQTKDVSSIIQSKSFSNDVKFQTFVSNKAKASKNLTRKTFIEVSK